MYSAELGKVVECTATTPLAETTLIEGEIPDPFGLESIRPTKQPSNETGADVPNQEITELIKQVVSPSTVGLGTSDQRAATSEFISIQRASGSSAKLSDTCNSVKPPFEIGKNHLGRR